MMEDDKKKKKNKKKKRQQQARAAAEDTASNAEETSSGDQNLVSEQKNHLNHSIESNGGIVDPGSNKIIGDKGCHNAEGSNGSTAAQIEKENWLQEEVRLREMVKQLLYEKSSYLESQADLEMKFKQLQCENDSRHEKEVSLGQRISQLLQEKASLSLEERSLQEKVRHVEKERAILVEKENSSKEMIATLNDENTRLRMQVVELEGAKDNLSQENMQLIDKISALQSQIQDLERSLSFAHSSVDGQKDISEKDDLNAQIEATCALVEKLVTENAELVEKVNELYMELGSQGMAAAHTLVGIPDYSTVHDPISGSSTEDISSSSKSVEVFKTVPIGGDDGERVVNDDVDSDYANVARHSSESAVSGEIVQIPLDEKEGQDLETQMLTNEGVEAVPLKDAPLIGAPFRLISFVAKYVSGADLVNQGASESPQLN